MRLWFEPLGCDLSLKAVMWALRLWFEPWGCDLSLEAVIWTLRLEFEPWGWDMSPETMISASRLGLETQDWDLSLEAGIWAPKMGGVRTKEWTKQIPLCSRKLEKYYSLICGLMKWTETRDMKLSFSLSRLMGRPMKKTENRDIKGWCSLSKKNRGLKKEDGILWSGERGLKNHLKWGGDV